MNWDNFTVITESFSEVSCIALSGCEGVDFMTLSGGGRGCRDDIIVHSSCDVSCDVN